MFYNFLIHQQFTDLGKYSPVMENNKSLIPTTSSAYAANSEIIDEYLALEDIFNPIFNNNATVTKMVNAGGTEQIIQIECPLDVASIFIEHAAQPRFHELRMLVVTNILGCIFVDHLEITDTASLTIQSFEDGLSRFQ